MSTPFSPSVARMTGTSIAVRHLFTALLLLIFATPLTAQPQPLNLDLEMSAYQSTKTKNWSLVNKGSKIQVENGSQSDLQGKIMFDVFHEGKLLLSTDPAKAASFSISPGANALDPAPITSLWKDLKVENFKDLNKLMNRRGKLKANEKCWICATMQDQNGKSISNEDCEWVEVSQDILPPQIIAPNWGVLVEGNVLEFQVAPALPISDWCLVQLYEKDPTLTVKETVQKRPPLYQERINSAGSYSIDAQDFKWKEGPRTKDFILTVTSIDDAIYMVEDIYPNPSRMVSFQWENPWQ